MYGRAGLQDLVSARFQDETVSDTPPKRYQDDKDTVGNQHTEIDVRGSLHCEIFSSGLAPPSKSVDENDGIAVPASQDEIHRV
jgi:hypothetical protein